MSKAELILSIGCVLVGVVIQYRSRKRGAADMQVLGAMIWVAGIILVMDSHWHFLTDPDH
jgi:hypothetical protein